MFDWWYNDDYYDDNDGCGGYDWLSLIGAIVALTIIAVVIIDLISGV